MCGIYGLVNFGNRTPSRAVLDEMGSVIPHRGPDDQGHYLGAGVGLGMRRLSIIDLAGGHQPIGNEDGSIRVVCNGEIYNFLELRQELEKKGHKFACHSDTEVLVHLYEQEGTAFLSRLRGMFAIALWDAKRSRLVLARDRLGKKPLYVRREADRLLFASEIKSILQVDKVPRAVDLEALREYLELGYVPAPRTMFAGIEKLLPGHFLEVEGGRVRQAQYWEPHFDQIEQRSEREWIELVRDKIAESVRIRLISDVPLGAFLSGGIDSSTIVAVMANAMGQPVKTYSIGFAGEDQYYNELPYAKVVANAFGTDHHEIIVQPDVVELLPKLIWHLDEPIADSASITTYLVSRLARESVTVILSGVGGDELFGGYRRYLGDAIYRYYRHLPKALRAKGLPALARRLPQDRNSAMQNTFRYFSGFVNTAELGPEERYMSYIRVFSPELRDQIMKSDATESDGARSVLAGYFARSMSGDSLNQSIYTDMKTSLPDDLLALTDKMTMAASLECRAPFMDHELVELTSRIPSQLKVRGLTMKYLLKKAVEPWLPAEILNRKKRGFGAPVGSWLRKDLEVLVEDTLSETQLKKRGFFDPHVVQDIVAKHRARRADHTDHLLSLINFEIWCRIFLDGNDRNFAPTGAALAASIQ
ncbi:MAG TPA: asparagine synthase (glutamine-hydrolyzing) [Alphaproteobacteria bacterium]|nr:asparagine synthase (glutamine-hydrolyzing) [Alphaproteobacteria bacterium]